MQPDTEKNSTKTLNRLVKAKYSKSQVKAKYGLRREYRPLETPDIGNFTPTYMFFATN